MDDKNEIALPCPAQSWPLLEASGNLLFALCPPPPPWSLCFPAFSRFPSFLGGLWEGGGAALVRVIPKSTSVSQCFSHSLLEQWVSTDFPRPSETASDCRGHIQPGPGKARDSTRPSPSQPRPSGRRSPRPLPSELAGKRESASGSPSPVTFPFLPSGKGRPLGSWRQGIWALLKLGF